MSKAAAFNPFLVVAGFSLALVGCGELVSTSPTLAPGTGANPPISPGLPLVEPQDVGAEPAPWVAPLPEEGILLALNSTAQPAAQSVPEPGLSLVGGGLLLALLLRGRR